MSAPSEEGWILILARLGPKQEGSSDPERLPMGRALLRFEEEGGRALLGSHWTGPGRARGWTVSQGRWREEEGAIAAVYDRYPCQSWPEAYEEHRRHAQGILWANPRPLVLGCRDKVASQELLVGAGLRMPELVTEPETFPEALERWGRGFLKPRHGSLGRGVRRVGPGDPLPARAEGARRGWLDSMILQRAIDPPEAWSGVALRVLLQTNQEGWRLWPAVARCSRSDAVVSVHQGAAVVPAEELMPSSALASLRAQARRAAQVLGEAWGEGLALELGLDFVVDAGWSPWLIEVNARPRGRLQALAGLEPRWDRLHREACLTPLRTLDHWRRGGR